MERKNVGESTEVELVLPKRTGEKAVVTMYVGVMVEVSESDDWNDMVHQAKDSINQRIIEGKGFYPFSSEAKQIQTGMKVEDLKYRTFVDERRRW